MLNDFIFICELIIFLNFQMNCSFCPFSAGNNRILVTHMIRAHSEKKKKLKKSAPSVQALAEALALVISCSYFKFS